MLPEIDTPQLLGLPANCRVAWEKNATNDILAGLRGIYFFIKHARKKLAFCFEQTTRRLTFATLQNYKQITSQTSQRNQALHMFFV